MSKQLKSDQETIAFGQKLGHLLQAGDVLVLSGDLGVGKTTLSKGIAQGLNITAMIKSPTYTLIREYEEGRLPLYHMDVYRLAGVADLGLEEYFLGDGVCLVEWGEQIKDELPPDYLQLTLKKLANGTTRELSWEGFGQMQERAEQLNHL